MSPVDWLTSRVPDFMSMPTEEHEAIFHFTLLWSLFENRVLGRNGNVRKIRTAVENNSFDLAKFDDSLAHFKNRYVQNGEMSYLFDRLFPQNNGKELVAAVLKGEEEHPNECVIALLIIVYRLRNNLFHGSKWEDEIQGQQKNFNHANKVLMEAIDQAAP